MTRLADTWLGGNVVSFMSALLQGGFRLWQLNHVSEQPHSSNYLEEADGKLLLIRLGLLNSYEAHPLHPDLLTAGLSVATADFAASLH